MSSSSPYYALVASSGIYIIEAFVCIVCMAVIFNSRTVPAAAVRLGVAGFACLLLNRIAAIGSVVIMTTLRDSFESVAALGFAMGVINFARMALDIAGLICVARAILSNAAHAQTRAV
jgi:hypothetical protein